MSSELELTRLRTLLEDLVRATEVFAKRGECQFPDDHFIGFGLQVSDLRRAREAYLKAKGE